MGTKRANVWQLRGLAAAGALCVIAASPEAGALPLLTLSGSARGLYGTPVSDLDTSPYGVGLGLRAGVTLPASLYLGGSFDYFFGESTEVGTVEASASLLQLMALLGYDLGLGPLTLRPHVGLGMAQASTETGPFEDSESDVVLAPGAELSIGFGLLTASAEARYNKIFADDADALVFGLGLGFSL